MGKNSNSHTRHDSQNPVSLGKGFIPEEYEKIEPFQQLTPDTTSYVQKSPGDFRVSNGDDGQKSITSLEGTI